MEAYGAAIPREVGVLHLTRQLAAARQGEDRARMALRQEKAANEVLRRQIKDPWSGIVAIDTLRAELTAVESAAAAITAITTKELPPPSKPPAMDEPPTRPPPANASAVVDTVTQEAVVLRRRLHERDSEIAQLRYALETTRQQADEQAATHQRQLHLQHQQPKSSHGYKAAFALTDAEELEQQRDALANERAALDRQRQELERRQWESGEREAACEAARQSERESERACSGSRPRRGVGPPPLAREGERRRRAGSLPARQRGRAARKGLRIALPGWWRQGGGRRATARLGRDAHAAYVGEGAAPRARANLWRPLHPGSIRPRAQDGRAGGGGAADHLRLVCRRARALARSDQQRWQQSASVRKGDGGGLAQGCYDTTDDSGGLVVGGSGQQAPAGLRVGGPAEHSGGCVAGAAESAASSGFVRRPPPTPPSLAIAYGSPSNPKVSVHQQAARAGGQGSGGRSRTGAGNRSSTRRRTTAIAAAAYAACALAAVTSPAAAATLLRKGYRAALPPSGVVP